MRDVLIIGVDPGTTVGWAALNFKGEAINIGSRKGMTPDELTGVLRDLGKILIVGADKAKAPNLVKTIGSRFRAKVVFPRKDLSRLEKKDLTKGVYFLNDHERDALAAAKFAYKKYSTLFRKINSYARKYGKKNIEQEIIEKVVKTDCSIVAAVEQIEKKEETKEIKKKEHKGKKTSVETILKKENLDLRKLIGRLQGKVNDLTAKTEKMAEKTKLITKEKPKEQVIRQKEQIIRTLREDLAKARISMKLLNDEKDKMLDELKDMKTKVLVKCLPNLGMQAIENVKKHLQKNEILYVDDPNSFSEKAVKALKEKDIDFIIHTKSVTKKVMQKLPFVFISKKDVQLKVIDGIGFLKKETLEKHKKLVMKKILQEYKESRTS